MPRANKQSSHDETAVDDAVASQAINTKRAAPAPAMDEPPKKHKADAPAASTENGSTSAEDTTSSSNEQYLEEYKKKLSQANEHIKALDKAKADLPTLKLLDVRAGGVRKDGLKSKRTIDVSVFVIGMAHRGPVPPNATVGRWVHGPWASGDCADGSVTFIVTHLPGGKTSFTFNNFLRVRAGKKTTNQPIYPDVQLHVGDIIQLMGQTIEIESGQGKKKKALPLSATWPSTLGRTAKVIALTASPTYDADTHGVYEDNKQINVFYNAGSVTSIGNYDHKGITEVHAHFTSFLRSPDFSFLRRSMREVGGHIIPLFKSSDTDDLTQDGIFCKEVKQDKSFNFVGTVNLQGPGDTTIEKRVTVINELSVDILIKNGTEVAREFISLSGKGGPVAAAFGLDNPDDAARVLQHTLGSGKFPGYIATVTDVAKSSQTPYWEEKDPDGIYTASAAHIITGIYINYIAFFKRFGVEVEPALVEEFMSTESRSMARFNARPTFEGKFWEVDADKDMPRDIDKDNLVDEEVLNGNVFASIPSMNKARLEVVGMQPPLEREKLLKDASKMFILVGGKVFHQRTETKPLPNTPLSVDSLSAWMEQAKTESKLTYKGIVYAVDRAWYKHC